MLRKWLAALRRLPPAPFVETESRRYSEAELAHVREVWLRYFNGTSFEAAVPGRKAPLRSVFKQRLAIHRRQRRAAKWFRFSLSLSQLMTPSEARLKFEMGPDDAGPASPPTPAGGSCEPRL